MHFFERHLCGDGAHGGSELTLEKLAYAFRLQRAAA
jgi:hypothetical protein